MNLQNRIEKLEKDSQIDVPAGAKLYDGDGVQVDATIIKIPGTQAYGEAQMADGTVRPIAPVPTWTLEGIIRRASDRRRTMGETKEKTEKFQARELPAEILFLRVDGRGGIYEIINRAQRRKQAGENNGCSI